MADEPLRSALSERDHQHLFRHEIAPLYFPEFEFGHFGRVWG